MTKFNTIQFASWISVDLEDELDKLRDMIKSGTESVETLSKKYNHLNSFIQGASYTVEFIDDDDTSNELGELLEEKRDELKELAPAILGIMYTEKLGFKVTVSTVCRLNGEKEYRVEGERICGGTFTTIEMARDYLKSQAA